MKYSYVVRSTIGTFVASLVLVILVQAGVAVDTTCASRTLGHPHAPRVLGAEATVSPNNSLIVNIEVTVDTASGVYVEYDNPDAGRFRSRTTESLDTSHTISVVRLRPSTTYCYQVFAKGADGRVSPGLPGTFTTGQLPAGLQETTYTLVQGQPTYPLTLMDYNEGEFKGMVVLDSQANVVWYYKGSDSMVRPISQKPNSNLVFGTHPPDWAPREITPLGEEVSRLDGLCTSIETSRGGWHGEVLLRPDNKVLLIGFEVHEAPAILGPGHGPQRSDTIEEWDQNTGQHRVLVDLFDLIPITDRTEASDQKRSTPFFRHNCSDQTFEAVETWTLANSFSVPPRGNMIVSLKHINQIISLAPDFQSIEWRLGGPGGQFDFPNSRDRFYSQHSAVGLPNGNVLLFDNGIGRPSEEGGEYSRALELRLDFETMAATKVWEYRHEPDLITGFGGRVTRLSNGNTVLSFSKGQTLVEADSGGNAVAVIQWDASPNIRTFRAQPINSIFGESELPPPLPPTPTPY